MRPLRLLPRIARAVLATLVAVAALLLALSGAAVALLHHLRPQPGDWQQRLQLPVPQPAARWLPAHALPAGWELVEMAPGTSRLRVPVGVAATLRWLSQPSVARLLAGTVWSTAQGRLTLGWNADTATQTLDCTPCSLHIPALGHQPLTLPQAALAWRRHGDQLAGTLQAGALQGQWQATLQPQWLHGTVELPEQPIAEAFALFALAVAEVQQADISGSFSLRAQFEWPGGQLALEPELKGFAVSGLGTQHLPQQASGCAHPQVHVPTDGLLARAVIATEDQRFFEHPGYDVIEWRNSLQHNQQRAEGDGQPLRGASTLTQQLAKISYTGGDRTPLRKLRELLYAAELEQTLGKTGILQQYLQRVYWGEGVCGAEAAAQHYFGMAADALNPAQAAWLAAMLHRPDGHASHWRQTGQIDLRRTQWVLGQMRLPSGEFGPHERRQWQQYAAKHDWTRQTGGTADAAVAR